MIPDLNCTAARGKWYVYHEMVYLPKDETETWHRRPLSPSIDRISNRQGYVEGNLRIVCACVNIGINEWGLELFQRVCAAVAEKQAS